MDYFAKDKADKLKRILPLRIMNAIGMIRWDHDGYGGAAQKLRMLHPLSWPWLILLVLIAFVMHGVIEAWAELKTTIRNDCVWW